MEGSHGACLPQAGKDVLRGVAAVGKRQAIPWGQAVLAYPVPGRIERVSDLQVFGSRQGKAAVLQIESKVRPVDHAESPVTMGIGHDGLFKGRLAKTRPECGRDIELAVTGLPQQEVADAKLVGRADQRVRVRQSRPVQMGTDAGLVHGLRQEPSLLDLARDRPDGVHDLCATAVVEGQGQDHTRVPARDGDRMIQFLLYSLEQVRLSYVLPHQHGPHADQVLLVYLGTPYMFSRA